MVKTQACRLLDTIKISYTLHEYDWAEDALDAETVAGKLGISPSRIFKTLVLRGDITGIFLVCIPGDRELNVKAVASVSGNKKARMILVKDLESVTGYVRGGVSPLGGKKKYPVYIDASIQDLHWVSVSAGKRGLQIFLTSLDLIRACDAKLVSVCC